MCPAQTPPPWVSRPKACRHPGCTAPLCPPCPGGRVPPSLSPSSSRDRTLHGPVGGLEACVPSKMSAPNSVLFRPSPGPGTGHRLGHKPAQVAKIRKSDQCGLRPVAGNSAQHPSARVWGDFRKEPLNVKMFPSDLPDLSSSQPHSSLPPPVFPGLPSQEQCSPPPPCPFCADTHSYTLLGGSPPAQLWGRRQRSSPSAVHPWHNSA